MRCRCSSTTRTCSGPARPVSEEVVVAYRPFSHEGERLRSLRSQLQLRWFDEGGKHTSLAIVGTHRGEGRSHLAANLAVTFAQAGERTLLIDGDLRNAAPAQALQARQPDRPVEPAGRPHAGRRWSSSFRAFPGLAVLPSGPIPPNPQELLVAPVVRPHPRAEHVDLRRRDHRHAGHRSKASTSRCWPARRGAALVVARNNLTRTERVRRGRSPDRRYRRQGGRLGARRRAAHRSRRSHGRQQPDRSVCCASSAPRSPAPAPGQRRIDLAPWLIAAVGFAGACTCRPTGSERRASGRPMSWATAPSSSAVLAWLFWGVRDTHLAGARRSRCRRWVGRCSRSGLLLYRAGPRVQRRSVEFVSHLFVVAGCCCCWAAPAR